MSLAFTGRVMLSSHFGSTILIHNQRASVLPYSNTCKRSIHFPFRDQCGHVFVSETYSQRRGMFFVSHEKLLFWQNVFWNEALWNDPVINDAHVWCQMFFSSKNHFSWYHWTYTYMGQAIPKNQYLKLNEVQGC